MKVVKLDAQQLCERTQQTQLSHGLSLYLSNLSRGREMTPRSWLYEHKSAESVLKQWIPIMTRANNKTSFGKEFNSFDLKQVEKFGPQGGIPPVFSKDCTDVIEPLYSPTEYDSESKLKEWFPEAEKFARKLFGSQVLRMRPLTPEAVVKDMARRDTLTTNSGYPRFSRRFKTQAEEVRDAKTLAAFDYPAIVLFRYYYGKLRPVWMFPMATNLIEAGFALAIQNCITHSPLSWVRDYCTPWLGFEYVKSVLTNQWYENAVMVGGDTTKMDAHMRSAQIQLVYEVVKWLFQKQYWPLLHQSLHHINTIPLLYGIQDGQYVMLEGVHGLASGSSWTQLTETVLQLFMAYTLSTQGQGIGDDFVWRKDMTADQLVDYLGKFGLPANPLKQSVSRVDLTFLQRYFHKDYFSRESDKVLGAYYPTIRALGSMLYPEKYHNPKTWNSNMFCIRNYMILENCVDDPCFEEFTRFCARGHKDMIPFAKQTASKLDFIQREARKVPGLFPNYNQEKLSKPLSSFQSINIARQL